MGCGHNEKDHNVTSAESKDKIIVNPGQFVLKQRDSIFHNYSLKEKLGEGNTTLQT